MGHTVGAEKNEPQTSEEPVDEYTKTGIVIVNGLIKPELVTKVVNDGLGERHRRYRLEKIFSHRHPVVRNDRAGNEGQISRLTSPLYLRGSYLEEMLGNISGGAEAKGITPRVGDRSDEMYYAEICADGIFQAVKGQDALIATPFTSGLGIEIGDSSYGILQGQVALIDMTRPEEVFLHPAGGPTKALLISGDFQSPTPQAA
jgi:hypothetical protein